MTLRIFGIRLGEIYPRSIDAVTLRHRPLESALQVRHGQQLFSHHSSACQPFYVYTEDKWQKQFRKEPTDQYLTIKLLIWNVNCKKPHGDLRMARALEYIHQISLEAKFDQVPLILFFQEMTASYLGVMQANPWIRSHFQITDIDRCRWAPSSTFGTTSLIDRRLAIKSVSRIPYMSSQGRDALFVDLELGTSSKIPSVILRLCNTHLESFNYPECFRPKQLALVSQYLHMGDVHAGIVAGDLNAIHKRYDAGLHTENELKDAYLENGGKNRGFTWGMHSGTWKGKRRYPCNRMDKILFCGNIQVKKPNIVGRGLEVKTDGASAFVSDHLGLMADLKIKDA